MEKISRIEAHLYRNDILKARERLLLSEKCEYKYS